LSRFTVQQAVCHPLPVQLRVGYPSAGRQLRWRALRTHGDNTPLVRSRHPMFASRWFRPRSNRSGPSCGSLPSQTRRSGPATALAQTRLVTAPHAPPKLPFGELRLYEIDRGQPLGSFLGSRREHPCTTLLYGTCSEFARREDCSIVAITAATDLLVHEQKGTHHVASIGSVSMSRGSAVQSRLNFR